MMSIRILKNNGGRIGSLETIEEQESLVGVFSSNEFVIGISLFNVMMMIVVVVISMMIIMMTMTCTKASH